MTCIAGIAHDGLVTIGGDSAGSSGHQLTVRADRKVFTNGPFLLGITSSYRMRDILRYRAELPVAPAGADVDALDRFMATDFVDALRKAFKDGGFAHRGTDAEKGGTFLVGYRGLLYEIQSDYQVARPLDPFAAVGSGDDVALGALYATEGSNLTPGERVELALRAAERFDSYVRGPFTIVELGWEAPESPPDPVVRDEEIDQLLLEAIATMED
jgi:ATP-dependent protease HslVU (ClpYQ) peptidase subunit